MMARRANCTVMFSESAELTRTRRRTHTHTTNMPQSDDCHHHAHPALMGDLPIIKPCALQGFMADHLTVVVVVVVAGLC